MLARNPSKGYMPRPPRVDVPGFTYHLINRGVKKLPIFHDDNDRQHFMRLLCQTQNEFPFILHGYCLMTNHYHLLLQTVKHSLSETMQYLNGLFGALFNKKNNHVGHVFQGRFHSIVVDTDNYFTTVSRYIHLNPVRAGIVQKPEDYPWSNYRSILRGTQDPITDSSFLLGYFGKELEKQRSAYRRFVEDAMYKPEPITERILFRMRYWARSPAFLNRQPSLSQNSR